MMHAIIIPVTIFQTTKSMNLKKLPDWLLSGILIFPVLIALGIIVFALTFGKLNALFWVIFPSILFEELFETCCYSFSNNQIANLLFAFIFWFAIGAVLGWLNGIVKKNTPS